MRTQGFNTPSKAFCSQTRQMQTIGMQTRHSLIVLLQKLACGGAHFVRCLRRNQKSSDIAVDREYLGQQIRSFGLVDTIRIRQSGYTSRTSFEEFLER